MPRAGLRPQDWTGRCRRRRGAGGGGVRGERRGDRPPASGRRSPRETRAPPAAEGAAPGPQPGTRAAGPPRPDSGVARCATGSAASGGGLCSPPRRSSQDAVVLRGPGAPAAKSRALGAEHVLLPAAASPMDLRWSELQPRFTHEGLPPFTHGVDFSPSKERHSRGANAGHLASPLAWGPCCADLSPGASISCALSAFT